jgi:corrinoid protein of di/trimethylamine methyltransferase
MEAKDVLLAKLEEAVLACDAKRAKEVASEVVAAGLDPVQVLNETVTKTAREVGERFESGQYFLPHLVLAGNAIEAASTVLQAAVPSGELGARKVIVIGTVEGDMHSLGKNIVAMMLRANGFEVHDLGVNVRSSVFVQQAQAVKADLIALSCLMTTTLPYQREVLEELQAQGLRERFKVIIGGGPVTQVWAQQIGADGYGRDVTEAVQVAKALLGLA